jgi:hypothetical protein
MDFGDIGRFCDFWDQLTLLIAQGQIKGGFHQDFATLENEINQWLVDHPDIQITHLTQCEMNSEQGRNIVVTMLFKNGPIV